MKLTHGDFEEVEMPDILEYLLYNNADWNEVPFLYMDEKVVSEVGNEYIHALIMFPTGSLMVCGNVKAHKQGNYGNYIRQDTCLYDVEFPDGEVTLLMAHAIEQAMHFKCDGQDQVLTT